jgi:hypothetical protein
MQRKNMTCAKKLNFVVNLHNGERPELSENEKEV